MNEWMARWMVYMKDKEMAEKCGMNVKDICNHEWISGKYMVAHCKKCGEFKGD